MMKRFAAPLFFVAIATMTLVGCSSSAEVADTTAVTEGVNETIVDESSPITEGNQQDGGIVETTIEDGVEQAVTSLTESPGLATDGFVGALKDVKVTSCQLDGAAWNANGTVTNSSGTDASYRIYVAFNVKGTTDTKAVIQADVDVANGKTEKWSASADVADKDLQCILRVERAKK